MTKTSAVFEKCNPVLCALVLLMLIGTPSLTVALPERDINCRATATDPACAYGTHIVSAIELDGVQDFQIVGNYAYVVHGTSGFSGLAIIDINNPSQPIEVGRLALPDDRRAKSIQISQGFAYIAPFSSSGFRPIKDPISIVDISDPTQPSIAGEVPVSSGLELQFLVAGSYLYSISKDSTPGAVIINRTLLEVFDIRSSRNPSRLSNLTVPFRSPGRGRNPPSLQLWGAYLYMEDRDRISVFDVSDPTTPLVETAITQNVRGLKIVGNSGLLLDENSNLLIWHLSSNPRSIQSSSLADAPSIFLGGAAVTIETRGGHTFASSSSPSMTRLFDTSDTSNPRFIGIVSAMQSHSIKQQLVGNYLFRLLTNQIRIFDISNVEDSPATLPALALSEAPFTFKNLGGLNLYSEGSKVAVPIGREVDSLTSVPISDSNHDERVEVIDLSDPLDPISTVITVGVENDYTDFMSTAVVKDGYILVGQFEEDFPDFKITTRMSLIDIQDIDNPVIRAVAFHREGTRDFFVVDSRVVLQASIIREQFDDFENVISSALHQTIQVFDKAMDGSLTSNPRFTLDSPMYEARAVSETGQYLYVSDDANRVLIHDLNSATPNQIVAEITTPGSVDKITVVGGKALLYGDFNGVIVLDPAADHAQQILNSNLLPVRDIALVDGVLFVDDARMGVERFQLETFEHLGDVNIRLGQPDTHGLALNYNAPFVRETAQFTRFANGSASTAGIIEVPLFGQRLAGYNHVGNSLFRFDESNIRGLDLSDRFAANIELIEYYETLSFLDSDMDGINDYADNCPNIQNIRQSNNDGDLIGDRCDSDDDNDGIPDYWETRYGLNRLLDDSQGNPDGDRRTNLEEYLFRSDPFIAETYIEIGPSVLMLLVE